MNSPPTHLGTTAVDKDEEEALQRMICDGLAPIALPPGAATGLRSRLLQRVGDSARRHAGLITVRTGDGTWRKLIKGVRSKLLHAGADGASVLIELAAGAVLPVHRHQHLEEGIVLRGSLQLGDLKRAGDVVSRFYRLAAGSRLPANGHAHEGECMLLAGDAYFGDILVRAGEFHLAPAGSTHGEISSEHGAVAFVRGHAS